MKRRSTGLHKVVAGFGSLLNCNCDSRNMLRAVGKSVVTRATVQNHRCFAAVASDPIQKLFLDKIKEYNTKSKSAPGGLVDSDEKLQKAFSEDMERVKRSYNVKQGEEAKIGVTFSDQDFKIDPINVSEWK